MSVLLLSKFYLFLLILLLFIISVLIILIQVRTKKYMVDLSLDVYTLINPYKVVSVHRSMLLISFYFLITLFPFLYLRSLYIGNKVFIGRFPSSEISLTFIMFSVVVVLVISMYLITINTLFYRELQKLHFFFIGILRYERFVSGIAMYPYQSRIITKIIWPLFHIVAKATLKKDIEDYIQRKQRLGIISPTEVKLLRFFHSLCKNYPFFRHLFSFFREFLFVIDYKFGRWFTVFPEIFLFGSLLIDIKSHELFYFYYFSFLYIFLIIMRKMKNFWVETDLACDSYIHDYLYKGERFGVPLIEETGFGNSEAYQEVKKYIKNGFKYWMMVDDPSRGPWHMLLKKDNLTQKYIYLLMIIFLGVIFDGSSYVIYCNFLDIEVSWVVLFLPILLCKYICEKKVFSLIYETQQASYNKIAYRLLWLFILLQYSLYLYIYFRNSFFDLCEETIINKFGFLITENFTYQYKMQYFFDYLAFSTENRLNSMLTPNYLSLWPSFNDSIEIIRASAKELIQNHLFAQISIDINQPQFAQFTELSYNSARNTIMKIVIIQEVIKTYEKEIYVIIKYLLDMYMSHKEIEQLSKYI